MKANTAFRPLLAVTLLGGAALLARAEDPAPAKAPAATPAATAAAPAKSATAPAADLASAAGWKLTLNPTGRYYWVRGNKALFREQTQTEDHFNGGLGVEFTAITEDGTTLDVAAKGSQNANEHEVAIGLSGLDNNWWIKGGSENFHKYYGDEGGYWEGKTPSSYQLGQALALDIGKIWVEAGVKTPDLPILESVSLSYEHSYRKGTEATEEWAVAPDGSGKNIYPATRTLNEKTDTITLNLQGKIGETKLADKLTYMQFSGYTKRYDYGNVLKGAASKTVEEDNQYHSLSNVLSGERWVTPKLHLSAGYMIVDQNGHNNSWTNQDPFTGVARAKKWSTKDVDLESTSNLADLNALLGPYGPFTLALGLTGEVTRTRTSGSLALDENSGTGVFTPDGAAVLTRVNKEQLGSNAELAYTAIPKTKLYLRGGYDKSWYQLEENAVAQDLTSSININRATDATRTDGRLRAGFTTNAVPRLTLGGYVERRSIVNAYFNEVDQGVGGAPLLGYSAFINHRSSLMDTLALRASSMITTWLSLNAGYSYSNGKIYTSVAPTAPAIGEAQSNAYDAHTYSLGATLTPCAAISLNSTGIYQLTRSGCPAIDLSYIDQYYAETTTLVNSITYHVNKTTDVIGSYAWGRSNSDESFNRLAMPFGVDYVSHAFSLGVQHQFTEKMSASLQGLYQTYDEDHYKNGSYQVVGLVGNLKWTF